MWDHHKDMRAQRSPDTSCPTPAPTCGDQSMSLAAPSATRVTWARSWAVADTCVSTWLIHVWLCLWAVATICVSTWLIHMGWLRLVGSIQLQVSFAKEPYKRDDILQKRPIILRSLLIVATPYVSWLVHIWQDPFIRSSRVSGCRHLCQHLPHPYVSSLIHMRHY